MGDASLKNSIFQPALDYVHGIEVPCYLLPKAAEELEIIWAKCLTFSMLALNCLQSTHDNTCDSTTREEGSPTVSNTP